MKVIKVLLIQLFICVNFFSYLYACRPLVIDDCPTVEKGKFSFETGVAIDRASANEDAINETTTIKYGVSDNMDIGIDIPYLAFRKEDDNSLVKGLGDLTLKSKINVISHENNFCGLTFVVGSKIANASKDLGFGNGEEDYLINAITTSQFGDGFFHLNLGYTLTGERDKRNVVQYGCSAEYPTIFGVRLLGEIVGRTNSDIEYNEDFLDAQIGFNKNIGGFIFDAGVTFGLAKESPANVYTVGLTREI